MVKPLGGSEEETTAIYLPLQMKMKFQKAVNFRIPAEDFLEIFPPQNYYTMLQDYRSEMFPGHSDHGKIVIPAQVIPGGSVNNIFATGYNKTFNC